MSDKGNTFFRHLDSLYPSLTKKQKTIADYLRNNYREAIFLSLARAADEAGVSEGSIIRFARALGYEGFTDMLAAVQGYVSESMQTTVERFRTYENAGNGEAVWKSIAETSLRNLESMSRLIAERDVNDFAAGLSEYSRILVAGFESTAGFAEYSAYYLSRAGYPAEAVTEKSGNLYPLVQQVTKKTLVLGLLVARYPAQAVRFYRTCVNRGARLAIVSDTSDHPLHDAASPQFSLAVRPSGGMNFDMHLAMLSFLQILMLKIGLYDKETTRQSLDSLEKYNKLFEIYN